MFYAVNVPVFDFVNGSGYSPLALWWAETTGTMYLRLGFGYSSALLFAGNGFPEGQWVHVAVTIDGQGNVAIYWNGTAEASGSMLGALPTLSSDSIYLGGGIGGGYASLTGAMGDVAIWSEAAHC